ncbi:putative pectinesterase 55 [Citrus sinensis]|uniref:Pectinesterase 55 n=1 Tax=Citrus sinensis TaxID=2711 RepID=A0ACB8KMD4_CITSI|nr:putative pectinesterase 55 [Citrus sinensis]
MRPVLKSLIVFTLLSTISFRAARADQDCKGSNVAYTVTVDQSSSQYRTVQSAIDSIPAENNQWIKVHIKAGTYKEKVKIQRNKPCILLEGEGSGVTKITYDDHQSTDTSATFSSFADNVVAKGITFENSYNLAVEILAELDRRDIDLGTLQAGNDITQALAARIYGDKSAFYDCRFLGVQDTLWDVQGRHFFKSCYIEGAIDFIFGNGQSVYEDCSVNSTAGLLFGRGVSGYITAQSRESANDPGGFVFRGGEVTGTGQAYLGRAYGPYSRVIFYNAWLSSVVTPPGWNAWNLQGQEGNFMYAEVNCKGPGSDTSNRVSWEKKIDPKLLYKYSTSYFINQDGWISKQPQ